MFKTLAEEHRNAVFAKIDIDAVEEVATEVACVGFLLRH